MADTKITFSGGLNNAKFGKIETPLQAAILHESDLLTTKGGAKDWLYVSRKSNKWAETVQYQDDLGTFTPTAEGESGDKDSFRETYNKLIQHTTFKKDIIITMEALQDANYGITADMSDKSSSLVRAYYRTQHELAQKMIYEGHKKEGFSFNGQTFKPTTCDGEALFYNKHTYGKNGENALGTQSNYFHTKDALSAEVIDDIIVELASKIRMMKDENGNAMGYVLDTLIIPGNTPKLEKLVKQYLGSAGEAKSSNNGINIGYGNYNLIILPAWAATDASIIGMSSEANKNLLGSIIYDRMPLDVKMREDESTRNLLINGTCRFGLGHNTYKHIVRCDIGVESSDNSDSL
jgi:hypothetical protein